MYILQILRETSLSYRSVGLFSWAVDIIQLTETEVQCEGNHSRIKRFIVRTHHNHPKPFQKPTLIQSVSLSHLFFLYVETQGSPIFLWMQDSSTAEENSGYCTR